MARARSLSEFQASFPDETSCAAFLFERRWPQGFVCPVCGHGRAASLKSRAHTYECLGCGRQTSITAGAVMHRSKLPLTVWFWAAHLMATHSNGMSALVSIEASVRANVKPGTTLLTDGHRSYPGLTRLPTRPADGRQDGGSCGLAMDSPGLLANEALGARHLSRAAPQARRHLPQRVCLPIQSALLPARIVRDHARARLAPPPDELLGYCRPRQSSQRHADSSASTATPKDSNGHAARWFISAG